MPATTITKVIQRAMSIADMRDNFVKETEWIDWANQEQNKLHTMLARFGWPQELHQIVGTITATSWTLSVDSSADVATTSSNGNYVLEYAADPDAVVIMAICGVWELSTDSTVRRLRQDNAVDFLNQLPNGAQATGHATRFRIFTRNFNQLNFNFYPTPQTGERYLIQVVLQPNVINDVGDTVNFPMGWEEWLVLKLARRALIKEESDPGKIEQMIVEMEREIEAVCWSKNLAEVPSVRNVDRLVYNWSDQLITPPWADWAWV